MKYGTQNKQLATVNPLFQRIHDLLSATLQETWQPITYLEIPELTQRACECLIRAGAVEAELTFALAFPSIGKRISFVLHASGDYSDIDIANHVSPMVMTALQLGKDDRLGAYLEKVICRLRLTGEGLAYIADMKRDPQLRGELIRFISIDRRPPAIFIISHTVESGAGASANNPSGLPIIAAAQANASVGDIHLHNIIKVEIPLAGRDASTVAAPASVETEHGLSVKSVADREGVDESTVRRRCEEGKYAGAQKSAGEWSIPASAVTTRGKPRKRSVSKPGPKLPTAEVWECTGCGSTQTSDTRPLKCLKGCTHSAFTRINRKPIG